MRFILAFLFLSLAAGAGHADESFFMQKMVGFKDCHLRVWVQNPAAAVKADLIFFIGYGDRADNHGPLFALLNQNGIRVISFDYPAHGESSCGKLDDENFTSLAGYAEQVELATRESLDRPLYVAGWSTGGLLAVRMAQQARWSSRPPAGLVLLAPGLSVYNLVGGDGLIRQETLLSNPNPPHRGPIQPISPLLTPIFAVHLLSNAFLARSADLPMHLPTLLILAGDQEDLYAKTPQVKKWALRQQAHGRPIANFQCAHAKHEVDNEIEPTGSEVRKLITDFVVSGGNAILNEGISCGTLVK